jgi:hypothetical protein
MAHGAPCGRSNGRIVAVARKLTSPPLLFPSKAQQVSVRFNQSNPEKKAGLLSQLLGPLGPAAR